MRRTGVRLARCGVWWDKAQRDRTMRCGWVVLGLTALSGCTSPVAINSADSSFVLPDVAFLRQRDGHIADSVRQSDDAGQRQDLGRGGDGGQDAGVDLSVDGRIAVDASVDRGLPVVDATARDAALVGQDAGADVEGVADATADLPTSDMGCSPSTCSGCCDSDGRCRSGTVDTYCGAGAARCTNCASDRGQCVQRHCQLPSYDLSPHTLCYSGSGPIAVEQSTWNQASIPSTLSPTIAFWGEARAADDACRFERRAGPLAVNPLYPSSAGITALTNAPTGNIFTPTSRAFEDSDCAASVGVSQRTGLSAVRVAPAGSTDGAGLYLHDGRAYLDGHWRLPFFGASGPESNAPNRHQNVSLGIRLNPQWAWGDPRRVLQPFRYGSSAGSRFIVQLSGQIQTLSVSLGLDAHHRTQQSAQMHVSVYLINRHCWENRVANHWGPCQLQLQFKVAANHGAGQSLPTDEAHAYTDPNQGSIPVVYGPMTGPTGTTSMSESGARAFHRGAPVWRSFGAATTSAAITPHRWQPEVSWAPHFRNIVEAACRAKRHFSSASGPGDVPCPRTSKVSYFGSRYDTPDQWYVLGTHVGLESSNRHAGDPNRPPVRIGARMTEVCLKSRN